MAADRPVLGIGVEHGLAVDSAVAVMTAIFLLAVSSLTSFQLSGCLSWLWPRRVWMSYKSNNTDSISGLSGRCLYQARIAFLRATTAFSKIISCTIGLKYCTLAKCDNTQNYVGRNFEFPPLKNFAPLRILRLHYGQWDANFKSALHEFPMLFWSDIFTHTSLQG